jgi:protein SCO1/2
MPDPPRPRSRRPILLGLAAIALGAAVALGLARDGGAYRGRTFEPPLEAADFTLTDMRGQPFRMSDLRGKVALLFFGFTSCPDICPNTLGLVAQALRELGEERAERVQVVFVSVDPERDTPAVIAEYLAGFDARFVGLTGSLEALHGVADSYFVTFAPVPGADGEMTISHSGQVFLIDPQGFIPVSHAEPFAPADLAHDLKLALGR